MGEEKLNLNLSPLHDERCSRWPGDPHCAGLYCCGALALSQPRLEAFRTALNLSAVVVASGRTWPCPPRIYLRISTFFKNRAFAHEKVICPFLTVQNAT
jgi:hypothetical protein